MNVSKKKLFGYWEVVFNSKTAFFDPCMGSFFVLAQSVRKPGNSSVFENWDICISQLMEVRGNYAYFKRLKDFTDDKVENYSIVIRKKIKRIDGDEPCFAFVDQWRKYPQTWIIGKYRLQKAAEDAAESLKKTIPSVHWTENKGDNK